jgi:predicted RNA binding protein YcfA (HicA-like mRNA interferase family)
MMRRQVLGDPQQARDQFSSEDLSHESQDPPPHPALERVHARGRKQACDFFAASLVAAVKKPKKRVSYRSSLNIMRVRDVIRLVEADGWRLVSTKGSHRQFKHPYKPGRVTIAVGLI